MHILIIPSWYPTNDNPINGIFFREQAHALKRAGHKVGVIYPGRKSLRKFRFEDRRTGRRIGTEDDEGVLTMRTEGWNWLPRIPHAAARFSVMDTNILYQEYIEISGKPDLIHAHSILFGGFAAAKVSEATKIPFVVTEHSTAFARGLISEWNARYLQFVFNKTQKVITVSPQLGDLLHNNFSCPRHLITFIPNIVDTEFFLPGVASKRESGKFIFFTVSFLTEKKGHKFLLEAFARNFRDQEEIALWIGGDGEERRNLEKLSRKLGISNQVNFLGLLSRAEVAETMRNCDVFVLPSLFETFGVVLIEALSCGKPIIATRCGGPESIVNQFNGHIVSIGDMVDLGEAMEKTYRNIEKFDSKTIRRDCVDRFSEQTVTSQLSKVYETIV